MHPNKLIQKIESAWLSLRARTGTIEKELSLQIPRGLLFDLLDHLPYAVESPNNLHPSGQNLLER